MKPKILNALLILTSLVGYLEWGQGYHSFLFEAEWEVLAKLFTNPAEAAHPFTLIPLAGQVLLVFTLFQKVPSRVLTIISIASLGLLLGFMFIIGLMSLNVKIALSTLPFVLVSIYTIRQLRKKQTN